MATYSIQAPNGQTYQIDGPDGATQEQVQAEVLRQYPEAAGASASNPPPGPHDVTDYSDPGDPNAQRPSKTFTPEQSAIYDKLIRTGNADQIMSQLTHWGYSMDRGELEKFVQQRDHAAQTGGNVDFSERYQAVKPAESDAPGAFGRGIADTLTFGTLPKIGAAVAGAESALTGGDFSDAYHAKLDENNAVIGADERDHPWLRISGQLLGGLVIPTGLEGVGLKAGTEVLRMGGTMQEARAAAAIAVRNRAIAMGAGAGAAHGAGSADNLPDAGKGALTEGALGALGGGVIGKAGEIIAPRLAARAAAARAAPEVISTTSSATSEAAQDIASGYGIRPTPATVGGGMAHAVQVGLGNLPGGMTAVAKGVERENGDVASAVRGVADSVGNVSTREGAGQAAIDGAQAYSAASRQEGKALYAERDRLMGGDSAPVTLDDTLKQIADIAAKYPTSKTLEALMQHPVIRKLAAIASDAKQGSGLPAELTLGEATDALSHVRGIARKLAQNSTDSDQITARVNDVKAALTSDVKRAAAAADMAAGREPGAEGSALAAQSKADAFWADRKQALAGTLKAPITAGARPTERSAESVYNQIDADTGRVGGNLARLRDTWFRLPEEARGTIAATKIDDMGRSLPGQQNSAGDAWSFDRFLTNFDTMSPQARNIMFGQRASEQLADLAAYSSRLRDLGKSRNFSNTAKNYISGAILATIGAALWHGAPMEAMEAAASIPASYAAATLFLKTPAMRQWTQAALKTAMISNPERAKTQGDILIKRLTAIARSEPAIANDVLSLQQRLTDAFSTAPQKVAANDKSDKK